jgi:hypothetical protein
MELILGDSVDPGKRVHVAFPVRISYWEGSVRTALEVACTYDIHVRGARVGGLKNVRQVGDLITVERGRNKALCRVAWIGNADSELRGQYGIECLEEERVPWLTELQELEESYDPVRISAPLGLAGHGNRRREPRFLAEGAADLLRPKGFTIVQAQVRNLSQRGCMVVGGASMVPGADLKLDLKLLECELTLGARIRYAAEGILGIEFQKIRRGDRPLLDYMLRKLAAEKREADSWSLEVVDSECGQSNRPPAHQ